MDDGSDGSFIIIMAFIAGFLLLQLRRTLGKKTGYDGSDEKKPRHPYDLKTPEKKSEGKKDNIVPLYPDQDKPEKKEVLVKPERLGIERKSPFYEKVKEIHSLDNSFNMLEFIDGAEGAYAMILESFWSGDKKTLRSMLSKNVFKQFSQVVDNMQADQITFGNKIKDIEKISIEEISLSGSLTEITLKFQTLILSYTKDEKDHILAGDKDRAVVLNDIWTFVRDVKSSDPNWTLTKTRSV